ncbi:MAG: hypothetical protein KTR31_30475 [Myxococcales bacterium]|nr:hypothetical protein [Myxococcales bacterium]
MIVFAWALGCATQTNETTPSPRSGEVDPQTGFEHMPDGSVNRVASVPLSPRDFPFGEEDCYGTTSREVPECVASGCTAKPHGRCAQSSCFNTWCECVYGCSSDADCESDEACLRPDHGLEGGLPFPQCVPASCRTNDDCPSTECGVMVAMDSEIHQMRLHCRTPEDQCRAPADCQRGYTCALWLESTWECVCAGCWCD